MSDGILRSIEEIKQGIASMTSSLGSIERKIVELETNRHHQHENVVKLEQRVRDMENMVRAMEGRIAWFTGAVAVTATILTQAMAWLVRVAS